MKILISITSFFENEKKYLDTILNTYKTEYADCELSFILSVNYSYPSSNYVFNDVKLFNNWNYTWNNKYYLLDHYQEFDYIIESDSDCLIPRKVFDYYVTTTNVINENLSEPLNYIAGMLSMEKDKNGNEYLITMPRLPNVKESLEINGKQFITPRNLHSTCFIADRQRYEHALNLGMKNEPYRIGTYTDPDISRTGIYLHLKKLVSYDAIKSGDCLVHHLPNKYWLNKLIGIPTKEAFVI